MSNYGLTNQLFNSFIISCLITFHAVIPAHTFAANADITIPIDGFVNSISYSSNNKLLFVSTSVYGSKDAQDVNKYGINIFKTKDSLIHEKIGFLPTGFGKIVAIDTNELVLFRKTMPTTFDIDLAEKYEASVRIISIKDPENPIETGSINIEGIQSAVSIERKLVAVSDGEHVNLVNYSNSKELSIVGKFNASEKCKTGYGNRKQNVRSLAFSDNGNQLHVITGNVALCSYNVSLPSSPVLIRGGHAGFGTKIIGANELLVLLGGASLPEITDVHRNITGGNPYNLSDAYDVVHNFERDEYANSITNSFRHFVLHNNYLIVNVGLWNGIQDRFLVYDIKNRSNPIIAESYDNDSKSFFVGAIAVSSDMRYILVGMNKQIKFIPLIKATIANTDGIKKLHKKALDTYTNNPTKDGAIEAVNILDKSSIAELINNRHTDISNKTQALLLNDYGYFLYKSGEVDLGLKYIKAALKYDYERKVAHYNLAEIYADQLNAKHANNNEELLAKINVHCNYYTKTTGKTRNCGGAYYLATTLEQADISVCGYVREAVLNNKFGEILSYENVIDANNDGILEFISKTTQGTARIESIGVYDQNREIVYSPRGEYDWNGSLSRDQDILPYAGFYYFALHDSGVPVQIVRSNSDYSEKVVCAVTNVKNEPYLTKSIDDALCKNIPTPSNKGKNISSSDVSIPVPSAFPYAIVFVDFNNDGKEENLVKIEYASGAGSGCDAEWHDILDNKNEIYTSHPERELLLELQDVDYSSRHPARCGRMATNWLKHNGKVLMERKFYGSHRWSSEMYRRVYKIENKNSELLCEFEHRKVIDF